MEGKAVGTLWHPHTCSAGLSCTLGALGNGQAVTLGSDPPLESSEWFRSARWWSKCSTGVSPFAFSPSPLYTIPFLVPRGVLRPRGSEEMGVQVTQSGTQHPSLGVAPSSRCGAQSSPQFHEAGAFLVLYVTDEETEARAHNPRAGVNASMWSEPREFDLGKRSLELRVVSFSLFICKTGIFCSLGGSYPGK